MNRDQYIKELLKDGVLSLGNMSNAKLRTLLKEVRDPELKDMIGDEIMYGKGRTK